MLAQLDLPSCLPPLGEHAQVATEAGLGPQNDYGGAMNQTHGLKLTNQLSTVCVNNHSRPADPQL